MTAVIVSGLAATGGALLATIAALIAHDGGDQDAAEPHTGADEQYAQQLHNLTDATVEMAATVDYEGRHHEDTVEIVTDHYMPVLNVSLARALYGKALTA